MKRSFVFAGIAVSALAIGTAQAQAPAATAFTYQGRLTDGGNAANGPYDFLFRLYDVPTAGNALGLALGFNDVNVANGLITQSLNFPPGNFVGDAVYLQIEVRPGASGGLYTVLTPRQTLTPTPYALHALDAAWDTSGNNIFNTNSGNVGIGTTNPLTKLHITGGAENTTLANGTIFMQSAGGPLGQIMTMDGDEINGWSTLHLNPEAATDVIMVEGGGDVGIGTAPTSGFRLDVNGRIHVRQNNTASAGIYFYQTTPAADRGFVGMRNDNQIGLYGAGGAGWGFVMDVATGNVGVNTTAPAVQFHVNGTARVNVLEITGADVAEKFPVSDEVKPGMVVMIDAKNAGKLCLAQGEYNKRVAGVVSGANGLSAGTILGHLPGNEDAPPIALSGRVWVHCDASAAAIEIGDMLTTSNTPGHAMAAIDASKLTGAVIGKAMTAIPQGEKGLVLVLVNLQ